MRCDFDSLNFKRQITRWESWEQNLECVGWQKKLYKKEEAKYNFFLQNKGNNLLLCIWLWLKQCCLLNYFSRRTKKITVKIRQKIILSRKEFTFENFRRKVCEKLMNVEVVFLVYVVGVLRPSKTVSEFQIYSMSNLKF